ncbi:MAG: hypothetical protein JWL77_4114 [Chthonomonadaceae bacterium]|nr:hypothetical protein [Chthonomonadaceae bacterium]
MSAQLNAAGTGGQVGIKGMQMRTSQNPVAFRCRLHVGMERGESGRKPYNLQDALYNLIQRSAGVNLMSSATSQQRLDGL